MSTVGTVQLYDVLDQIDDLREGRQFAAETAAMPHSGFRYQTLAALELKKRALPELDLLLHMSY